MNDLQDLLEVNDMSEKEKQQQIKHNLEESKLLINYTINLGKKNSGKDLMSHYQKNNIEQKMSKGRRANSVDEI